jgi:hypothetical protein
MRKPKPGIDYPGGAKFGPAILAAHPEGWAAGLFWNTFGSAARIAEELADTGKAPRIRVHLGWVDSHRFSSAENSNVVRSARALLRIAKNFPKIDWRASTGCEALRDRDAAKKMISRVSKVFGSSIQVVNSPMTEAGIVPRSLHEWHGAHEDPLSKARFDFSFDGTDPIDWRNVRRYLEAYQRAETFYIWSPRMNGRESVTDTTPRADRTAWADVEEIRRLEMMLRRAMA